MMIGNPSAGKGGVALLAAFLIPLLAAPVLAKKAPGASPAASPVVTVQGKPVYLHQINTPELYKKRQEVFQMEQSMLVSMVMEKLRKSKPGEFPVPEFSVNEGEVKKLYQQVGLKERGSIENFRPRLEAYLLRSKAKALDQAQFQEAIRKGYVKSFHQPPPVYLVRLPHVKRPASHGPRNAPVHLVEFSDFQCPYCRRTQPTLRELRSKYGKRLHMVFRHLPLSSIHPEARAAAEASECAAEQGRFWPFQALLFNAPQNMTPADFSQHALASKVPDLKKFQSCVSKRRYSNRVEKDLRAAQSLGMRGTPSFFVGRVGPQGLLEGEVLSGAQPLEVFSGLVDKYLEKP